MKRRLLIDNWTLQDVGELLAWGLPSDETGEIEIAQDLSSHSFSFLPRGVISIDACLTFLTNIVLYDQLLVDEKFMFAWDGREALTELLKNSIIQGISCADLGEPLVELQGHIVEELAVTPTLKSELETLSRFSGVTARLADPHLSALLWGGAAMLARSHLTETPYFGHPYRRRLIRESAMFSPRNDAWRRTESVVSIARTEMFRFRCGELEGTLASFHLPPIAVEIRGAGKIGR